MENPKELWANHLSRMTSLMKERVRELNCLWVDMGFSQERMRQRMDTVEKHCNEMFSTMVEEEEEYRSILKLEIKKYTEELKTLALELKKPVPLNESFKAKSLTVAENSMKRKLDEMRKEKEERLQDYWQLRAKDKTTSLQLGVEEYIMLDSKVPTWEFLEKFKKCLTEKEQQLERVKNDYCEKKEIILSLMSELEKEPSTPLERNIVSDDIDSIRFNKEFLNAVQLYHQELLQESQDRKELAIQLRETLSFLWDRLCVSPNVREAFHEAHPGHRITSITALRKEIERCEELKRQNIQQFIEKLRTEVRELWENCLLGVEEELEFPEIKSTNYTEELLELHELEVIRLKKEAEDSKNVLEYLGKWNKLFNKQVDLDERVEDPERLFVNRGGQLLKEEKERKAIQKELPKIEAILKKEYLKWSEKRGRKFIYEGHLDLCDYIEARWNEYNEQKEIEKLERKQAKERLLDQEIKLGTQIGGRHVGRITPSKNAVRRLIEKPYPCDTGAENVMAVPLSSPENQSSASTIATYADFTHHLENLNKNENFRSSTVHEATPGDRHPTPLRPFNAVRIVPIVHSVKQIPGSSKKSPRKETAATPARATCRTPGTPRTVQMKSLRSKSETRNPKLTTPLRPVNAMKAVTTGKQMPGSTKTPMKETATTPARANCRTPGTPRTIQLKSLHTNSETRLHKLTTPRSKLPFLC